MIQLPLQHKKSITYKQYLAIAFTCISYVMPGAAIMYVEIYVLYIEIFLVYIETLMDLKYVYGLKHIFMD